jgi:hypothetical protein
MASALEVEHLLNRDRQRVAEVMAPFDDDELEELVEALATGSDVHFSRGKRGKIRVGVLAAVSIMSELHRRLEVRELEN